MAFSRGRCFCKGNDVNIFVEEKFPKTKGHFNLKSEKISI